MMLDKYKKEEEHAVPLARSRRLGPRRGGLKGPILRIDLPKIEANARYLCSRLPKLNIVGVVKVVCGDPAVARALVAGGVRAIADSRIKNLQRLRRAGFGGPDGIAPLWLLRAPTPAQAGQVVRVADVSLNSELETLTALDAAARAAGRRHSVILMVDLGDLREGMLPGDLEGAAAQLAKLSHLDLLGLGTNLTCYGGVIPTPENLGLLVDLADRAQEIYRGAGRIPRHPDGRMEVSGGNSSSLEVALAGKLPFGVTGLRVGESILLGVSTITRLPLEGFSQDAFVIEAPVIECRRKPSYPIGEIAQDAFGRHPTFIDRGPRLRAICAIGRQDCVPEGLYPLDSGVEVLGASSDHLIVDVEAMPCAPKVGDALRFRPSYAALLAAATSPYVHRVYVHAP